MFGAFYLALPIDPLLARRPVEDGVVRYSAFDSAPAEVAREGGQECGTCTTCESRSVYLKRKVLRELDCYKVEYQFKLQSSKVLVYCCCSRGSLLDRRTGLRATEPTFEYRLCANCPALE